MRLNLKGLHILLTYGEVVARLDPKTNSIEYYPPHHFERLLRQTPQLPPRARRHGAPRGHHKKRR